MAIAPFKCGPSGTHSIQFGYFPTTLFSFGPLETVLGNLKQLWATSSSKGFNLKRLHSKWAIYKCFIEIWIQSETFEQIPTASNGMCLIETVSIKRGYHWKELSEVEEVNSDLHMLTYLGKLQQPKSNMG